ncbi:MAG: DNA-3-methyladenine glycosylase [Bryobacterales bacterium]|nr:DNA-3-methyladenine glycosylase [Bryobacteraceae bacterium]MDW8353207.1 DNA-3-methyladenine glycosylase [Bryobacterales bacterium]
MRKAVEHLKRADPKLAKVITEVGPYRIRYLPPNFETLAKAIVYQQLSGKVAGAIFRRLREAAGNGRLSPEAILRLDPERMRATGLSRQKIEYLRTLARCVQDGSVDLASLRHLPDQEVVRRLTQLKGVGEWTAHMFLIFALRRPDVLPAGDLGIRAAVRKLYHLPRLPSPREVESLARPWRPYATVASWYLWRSLEPDANL